MSIAQSLSQFHYFTLRFSKHDGVDILGWGTYPASSVLAGQPMKVFLDNQPSEDEAKRVLREALVEQKLDPKLAECNFSSHWTEPQVSLSHLPGEDDPVPGGMYPDDIGDDDDDRTSDWSR